MAPRVCISICCHLSAIEKTANSIYYWKMALKANFLYYFYPFLLFAILFLCLLFAKLEMALISIFLLSLSFSHLLFSLFLFYLIIILFDFNILFNYNCNYCIVTMNINIYNDFWRISMIFLIKKEGKGMIYIFLYFIYMCYTYQS